MHIQIVIIGKKIAVLLLSNSNKNISMAIFCLRGIFEIGLDWEFSHPVRLIHFSICVEKKKCLTFLFHLIDDERIYWFSSNTVLGWRSLCSILTGQYWGIEYANIHNLTEGWDLPNLATPRPRNKCRGHWPVKFHSLTGKYRRLADMRDR